MPIESNLQQPQENQLNLSEEEQRARQNIYNRLSALKKEVTSQSDVAETVKKNAAYLRDHQGVMKNALATEFADFMKDPANNWGSLAVSINTYAIEKGNKDEIVIGDPEELLTILFKASWIDMPERRQAQEALRLSILRSQPSTSDRTTLPETSRDLKSNPEIRKDSLRSQEAEQDSKRAVALAKKWLREHFTDSPEQKKQAVLRKLIALEEETNRGYEWKGTDSASRRVHYTDVKQRIFEARDFYSKLTRGTWQRALKDEKEKLVEGFLLRVLNVEVALGQ